MAISSAIMTVVGQPARALGRTVYAVSWRRWRIYASPKVAWFDESVPTRRSGEKTEKRDGDVRFVVTFRSKSTVEMERSYRLSRAGAYLDCGVGDIRHLPSLSALRLLPPQSRRRRCEDDFLHLPYIYKLADLLSWRQISWSVRMASQKYILPGTTFDLRASIARKTPISAEIVRS